MDQDQNNNFNRTNQNGNINNQQMMPPQYNAKTNSLAVASLVLSLSFLIPIVGFISNITAIILGIIAIGQIKKTGENGKGMAIAGIVISSIVLFVILVIAILMIVAAATSSNSSVNY